MILGLISGAFAIRPFSSWTKMPSLTPEMRTKKLINLGEILVLIRQSVTSKLSFDVCIGDKVAFFHSVFIS